MMTGYGSIASAVEAVKRGANCYLQKPFSVQELISCFKGETERSTSDTQPQSLAKREREYIEFVLQSVDGNISTAAKRLGIHRQSLQRKLRKFSPTR
jgi:two-component system, response regulator RegA